MRQLRAEHVRNQFLQVKRSFPPRPATLQQLPESKRVMEGGSSFRIRAVGPTTRDIDVGFDVCCLREINVHMVSVPLLKVSKLSVLAKKHNEAQRALLEQQRQMESQVSAPCVAKPVS